MKTVENIDRPKFREFTLDELVEGKAPESYDLVQLKMDGIWGCMTLRHGEYTITSRTGKVKAHQNYSICLLYTSPSPRDLSTSRMPSSA